MTTKLLALLLTLSLALTLGCDEDTQEEPPPAEPVEVEEEAEDEVEEEEEEEEEEEAAAVPEDGHIAITATASTFEPSLIHAPAGQELTLTFLREVDAGCMTEVVFPELEIEEELPLGEEVVVTVTPEEGQAITFECGMGMGKSTITGT